MDHGIELLIVFAEHGMIAERAVEALRNIFNGDLIVQRYISADIDVDGLDVLGLDESIADRIEGGSVGRVSVDHH
jgi:hypothetical protein